MIKRAGSARAMALDPDILFFDEPSAGLDPVSAHLLDELILELRDSLRATVSWSPHELPSIFAIATIPCFSTWRPGPLTAHVIPKSFCRPRPIQPASFPDQGRTVAGPKTRRSGSDVATKTCKTMIGAFVLGAGPSAWPPSSSSARACFSPKIRVHHVFRKFRQWVAGGRSGPFSRACPSDWSPTSASTPTPRACISIFRRGGIESGKVG